MSSNTTATKKVLTKKKSATKKEVKLGKRRKPNGSGSVFKRYDGIWVGSVYLPPKNDDKGDKVRKVIYGHKKGEMVEKVNVLLDKIPNVNKELILGKNTLNALMLEWLFVFKRQQVSSRTFENNLRAFRLYIRPNLGKIKVKEITCIHIQKLLNKMLDKGLSLDYVKKTKFLLRQFFEYVQDNDLITKNPVNRTRVRATDRRPYDDNDPYKAIPIEVRKEFLSCLENHDFLKPLCLTMMCAGLRAGEVLGLKWKDINFSDKTLRVERAITEAYEFDCEGNVISERTIVGATKTASSRRTVPMPDLLIDALKEWQEKRSKVKKYGMKLLENNAFVFGNDDGSVRTYSGTRHIFSAFLKRYNLQKYGIHFHGLRHTYSNMLFEANQNPKMIQQLLGHKDVKTTLAIYNSVDKSYFDKAAQVLNNTFSRTQNENTSNETTVEETTQKEEELNIDDNIDDDIDDIIRLLEAKKKARKKQKQDDFEM